jgi:hypothetical protein
MADRKAIDAVNKGTIKPYQKQEFYIEELKKILQMSGREIAADTPSRTVRNVVNYKQLSAKVQGHIQNLRKKS